MKTSRYTLPKCMVELTIQHENNNEEVLQGECFKIFEELKKHPDSLKTVGGEISILDPQKRVIEVFDPSFRKTDLFIALIKGQQDCQLSKLVRAAELCAIVDRIVESENKTPGKKDWRRLFEDKK